MATYEPLKVTAVRMDIWTICKQHDDSCTGCPYKYKCEEHFPSTGHGLEYKDYLPTDYELNEDKTLFIVKEVK